MKNYLIPTDENDLFTSLFNDFFKPNFNYRQGIMATDVSKTDNGVQLEIEMPGFSKDEIELTYEKGYLYVGARKSEKDKDKKHYSMRERNVQIRRSYYVGDIDESGISAKYDAGVLTVVLPDLEKEEKVKKIAID